MKAIATFILVLFFGVAANAQSNDIKDVKVETIEMGIVLDIGAENVAGLRRIVEQRDHPLPLTLDRRHPVQRPVSIEQRQHPRPQSFADCSGVGSVKDGSFIVNSIGRGKPHPRGEFELTAVVRRLYGQRDDDVIGIVMPAQFVAFILLLP